MIAIDEKSLLSIKNKLKSNNQQGENIRIYFSGVGADGPIFDITIDNKKVDDLIYHIDGMTVLVNEYEYMQYGDFRINTDNSNHLNIKSENMELSMCCGQGCPDCPY